MYTDKKMNLIHTRYKRECREKTMRKLTAPGAAIAHTRSLVVKIKKELEEVGITEGDYRKVVNRMWMVFERETMVIERQEKCLHWLYFLQTDPLMSSRSICGVEDKDCFDCPDYKEATEEQQIRYSYNLDIDTGDARPPVEGLEDLE